MRPRLTLPPGRVADITQGSDWAGGRPDDREVIQNKSDCCKLN